MKNLPRWGLMTVIFAVAMVFFGSVICPPVGEREAESADSEVQYPLHEDAGTYKALPGSMQIEDRFPLANPPLPMAKDGFSTIEVTVLDDKGNPVEGARVAFLFHRESGYARRSWGFTDSNGMFTSTPLFAETYAVEASSHLFFPVVSKRISIPSEEQSKVVLRMVGASRLTGKVMTSAGRQAFHGHLSFTDLSTGKKIKGLIGSGGSFLSPPLDAGNWRILWQERPTAQIDPRLSYAVPLEPRQEREFRIVVPSLQSGGIGEHEIGIQEVLN